MICGAQLVAGVALAFFFLAPAVAWADKQGSWSIGVRFGPPVQHRPWYGYPHHHHYYRPYPVYMHPAPVYVQPAPVIVQAQPVIQPAPIIQPAYQPPQLLTPAVARPPVQDENGAEIQRQLQQLTNPDETARADSVLWLGRQKAQSAIDPLAATLAGDRSPMVRETAARALGLIGSPKGLPALRHAALADADPKVRHTAQFAAEIIQSAR